MLQLPPDPPPVVAPPVGGPATIIDGDTLEVAGNRFHLWGIDAPEPGQICERAGLPFDCGHEATGQLRHIVGDRTVICRPTDQSDAPGATVAICSVDYRVSESDAGKEMVETGWALERVSLSQGRYRFSQDRAKEMRLGLWMGYFQMPWEWRAQSDRPPQEPPPVPPVMPGRPPPIADGFAYEGRLGLACDDVQAPDGRWFNDHELPMPGGQAFGLNLSSSDFAPRLQVIDPGGTIMAAVDAPAGPNGAVLIFTPHGDARLTYRLRATTVEPGETGHWRLEVMYNGQTDRVFPGEDVPSAIRTGCSPLPPIVIKSP